MKRAAIVAGFLLFGAGLADAAEAPAVTTQSKHAVRAEQGDGPVGRKMSKEERLMRKRCENVERFVSRWPNYARTYVEDVRRKREAKRLPEGNGERGPELSARELRDLQRAACHAAHKEYGADIVGRHSDKITLYETLAPDIKAEVPENHYDAFSPELRVGLHRMKNLYEGFPPGLSEEFDETTYLLSLPQDLFEIFERNAVIDQRDSVDRLWDAERGADRSEEEDARAEADRGESKLDRFERLKRFRR